MSDAMRFILEAAMIVLAVGMCLAFLRAVKGPRFMRSPFSFSHLLPFQDLIQDLPGNSLL